MCSRWECSDPERETSLHELLATLELPARRLQAELGTGSAAEVVGLSLNGIRVRVMPTASSGASYLSQRHMAVGHRRGVCRVVACSSQVAFQRLPGRCRHDQSREHENRLLRVIQVRPGVTGLIEVEQMQPGLQGEQASQRLGGPFRLPGYFFEAFFFD